MPDRLKPEEQQEIKRAGSSLSRVEDNLNSAVRQYRHAVHGMDCTCKDCTRLLKILVSPDYELKES